MYTFLPSRLVSFAARYPETDAIGGPAKPEDPGTRPVPVAAYSQEPPPEEIPVRRVTRYETADYCRP